MKDAGRQFFVQAAHGQKKFLAALARSLALRTGLSHAVRHR
jgi:hypothetical protein